MCKTEIDDRDVWALKLELTFPVLPEDLKKELQDDSEPDFARRAFERVRPALEKLLQEGAFKHYHIIERPRKVID